MRNYSNDYLSEFEKEFDMEFETDTMESAYGSDSENDLLNSEFENDFEFEEDTESSDNFEMENDEESDYLSEFEEDDFGINNNYGRSISRDREFENRFYELFTNNYESEMEFENDFNEILHEMEKNYFWGGLKKLGSKAFKFAMPLAQKALKNIPGGEKYAGLLQSLTTNPRNFLRNAIKTVGPMALNAVAPGAGSVLGAVMNSEVNVPQNKAKQAAQDTVAVGKKIFTDFANNIAKIPPTGNLQEAKNSLSSAAKAALQGAVSQMKQRHKNEYSGRHKRVVRMKPNSIVSVHPDHIVIWET